MISAKTIRSVVAATFPEDDKTKWEQVSKSDGYGGKVRTYRNTSTKRTVDITESKDGTLTVFSHHDITKKIVITDIEAHLRSGQLAMTKNLADASIEEMLSSDSVWNTTTDVTFAGLTLPANTMFKVRSNEGGYITLDSSVAGLPEGTRIPISALEDNVTVIRLGTIRRLVILKRTGPRSYVIKGRKGVWTADIKDAEFYTTMSELTDFAAPDDLYGTIDVNTGKPLDEPKPVSSYTDMLLNAEKVSQYPHAKKLFIDNIEQNLGFGALLVSKTDLTEAVSEAVNRRVISTDEGSAALVGEMDALILQYTLPEGVTMFKTSTGEVYS